VEGSNILFGILKVSLCNGRGSLLEFIGTGAKFEAVIEVVTVQGCHNLYESWGGRGTWRLPEHGAEEKNSTPEVERRV
jgi:hypothetical protein